jgi:prepilin-type N-terminal cleavage/methylation domain-containing protein
MSGTSQAMTEQRVIDKRSPERSTSTEGFTLIEVLVAFTIAALMLGAMYGILASDLRSEGTAESYRDAVLIGQSAHACASRFGWCRAKSSRRCSSFARGLGLEPGRIDIAEESGHRADSENMFQGGLAPSGRFRRMLPVYGLAGMATILAIALIVVPIVRTRETVDALQEELAATIRVAREQSELRQELDGLRKSELFLVDKKRDAPTVSALLFETTRLLPDTTWLEDWQLSGKALRLRGVSQSASDLVGVLEQSQLFSHTTFLSPVTRDSDAHEHFQIATVVASGANHAADAVTAR